jgi:hypothetical protein
MKNALKVHASKPFRKRCLCETAGTVTSVSDAHYELADDVAGRECGKIGNAPFFAEYTIGTASSTDAVVVFDEFQCANNPVKYTDPTGRESGYVMDENAVAGFGHSGWYVVTENGYAFFEVTGLDDDLKAGGTIHETNTDGTATDGSVMSNSRLRSPGSGAASSSSAATSAGVVRRDFSSKGEMNAYLAGAGSTGAYESVIQFNTTPEQDKIILDASGKIGEGFNGYKLIGNNCGTVAQSVLSTPGSGISATTSSSIPNRIGKNLLKSNPGIASKIPITR